MALQHIYDMAFIHILYVQIFRLLYLNFAKLNLREVPHLPDCRLLSCHNNLRHVIMLKHVVYNREHGEMRNNAASHVSTRRSSIHS